MRAYRTRRQFLRDAGAGIAALGAMGGVGLLESCGGSSGSGSKTVTLNVAMYDEPSRNPIQQAIVDQFQKDHPNIKLSVQTASFNTYYTKFNTNLAAGTLPDVFMMSGAYFYNAAQKGALKDLGSYLASSKVKLSDYFTESANQTWHGKTMAVPKEIDILALAYNKDLFDQAGIKYPTAGWTWDDLLAAAQKITALSKPGQEMYGFYSYNSGQQIWGDLVAQNGGGFLNQDMNKGALDSDAAVEAIQFAVDLVQKYKVSPPAQGVSSLPGYIESGGNPFLTGRIGMNFQGNYEMGLLAKINSFKWDVTTMPARRKSTSLGWTQAWAMANSSQHPDEAWTFIEYAITKGNQITAKDPGRGLAPSLKSAAYSPDYSRSGTPSMKPWLDGWASHTQFDFHPAWFEYQTAYGKALDAVFAGSAPVRATLQQATSQVNDILARYPWFDRKAVQAG